MISFTGNDPSLSTTKIYRSASADMVIAGSSPIPLDRHAFSQSLHMEQSVSFSVNNFDFLASYRKDTAGTFVHAHSACIAGFTYGYHRMVLESTYECRLPFCMLSARIEDGMCFNDEFLTFRKLHDRYIIVHRSRMRILGNEVA